jgi:hypothetical protein
MFELGCLNDQHQMMVAQCSRCSCQYVVYIRVCHSHQAAPEVQIDLKEGPDQPTVETTHSKNPWEVLVYRQPTQPILPSMDILLLLPLLLLLLLARHTQNRDRQCASAGQL